MVSGCIRTNWCFTNVCVGVLHNAPDLTMLRVDAVVTAGW